MAIEQREPLGCVGVVTDAKRDAVGFYEELGFQALEGVREGLLLSKPLPMFLDIGTIAATLVP
ncbi:MAG: acetyltransferase [Deltaproteobacteria bacterium]|nr:acetyltransferase [Deltaproteobacteria bacterium]